jgi:hypothetical protein
MKSSMVKIVMSAVAFLLVTAPSSILAMNHKGWVLYDNFQSTEIDTDKWDIDSSSASISIENGTAKFVHDATRPNDSSWLIFKKSPEKIRAIRVRVKIANDTPGDARARVGGYLGKNKVGDVVWLSMQLRNDWDRVEASAVALTDTTSTAQWLYDLFYAQVGKPDGLVGNWYVLEMHFNRSHLSFNGNGVGHISHCLTEPVLPLDNFFKGIGTRNAAAASASFTVYFDNVYVLY